MHKPADASSARYRLGFTAGCLTISLCFLVEFWCQFGPVTGPDFAPIFDNTPCQLPAMGHWAGVTFGLRAVGVIMASTTVTLPFRCRAPVMAMLIGVCGATWAALILLTNMPGHTAQATIVGGIWIGLISLTGARTGRIPGTICMIGGIVAGSAIATLATQVADPSAKLFGVGAILWFLAAGMNSIFRPCSSP